MGGRRYAAAMGGEVRGAAGAVRGLEECLPLHGNGEAEGTRDRADYAVWADVPEAGDRAHWRQLAAGEGTRRARSRNAPRSLDQKDAAEANPHVRGSQWIPRPNVSGAAQREVRCLGARCGGLPSGGAATARSGPGVLPGGRTHGVAGLGRAVRATMAADR